MRAKVTFGLALMVMIAITSDGSAQAYWWGNTQTVAANPLGLTSEQMVQIQTIETQWQSELAPLYTQLQTKSLELQSFMWSSTSNPSEVAAKTNEVNELQTQIQRKSLEKQTAIRNVLTDQQKVMYDQSGLGTGWNSGLGGMGLGRMNSAGWYGRGGGFGRGGGYGRGVGFASGRGYGLMPGMGMPGMGMTGMGTAGMGMTAPLGWGRGPCGMGLGRTWGRGRGRW